MQTHLMDRRVTWLLAGMLLGMAVTYYCPAEPAYAETAVMGERFAMATCNTIALNSEAVFVLDMVTGRLIGAGYSTTAGGFVHSWARNLAADFSVTTKAQYVMVTGFANLQQQGGGGAQPASGVIYIGELTSGLVNMYGFYYPQANAPLPTAELVRIGTFPWRQSSK
ncbi:hypothetical protein [Planctomicrobium piriforme]|uniref:Uncharacterized protein n=1 Tax=Planctomicrobium piriforme TaxID=1576369 RepID=A0A1I3RNC2_9PLAN|nr:hypothetical protein [Planctomicrobium piriforme]SFJ47550.1 hypothetical protein SAMN05421753_12158 [Planctomicrobium piriforme]